MQIWDKKKFERSSSHGSRAVELADLKNLPMKKSDPGKITIQQI